MMVPAGSKRSLNLTMDFVDGDQRLYGYKTLNLLNANGDASYLSSVLYSHIARKYIAAPKANFVRVVINGENWGIYVNVQQFNKEFVAENFGTTKGARWKVSGNPGADGGLRYFGDELDEYNDAFKSNPATTNKLGPIWYNFASCSMIRHQSNWNLSCPASSILTKHSGFSHSIARSSTVMATGPELATTASIRMKTQVPLDPSRHE